MNMDLEPGKSIIKNRASCFTRLLDKNPQVVSLWFVLWYVPGGPYLNIIPVFWLLVRSP
jgi:hypothetical protein